VFGCKRLEERALHHPMKLIEPGYIVRQGVILHNSTILLLIKRGDGVVAFAYQFWAMMGFIVPGVS
jgi:hypothetical protein